MVEYFRASQRIFKVFKDLKISGVADYFDSL